MQFEIVECVKNTKDDKRGDTNKNLMIQWAQVICFQMWSW